VRRRRHALVAVGSAAAAVALVLAALLARGAGDDEPGRRVGFPVGAVGVEATATMHAHEFGTEIQLEVSGLDEGRWYWLWLTGDDGRRVTAGTFRGGDGPLEVSLTAAIALRDARRVWVTDDDDAIVLDAPISTPPA
jgi:hypothetical protein